MIRAIVAFGALIWAAVGIAATVAIARTINVIQDPDRAPLDRRDAQYIPDDVEDFIRSAASGEGPA